jgi:undecaprenyl-diphosphatase
MNWRRWQPRQLLLFVVAAAATIAFVAIADELVEGDLDKYDRAWALAIHGIDRDWLDVVMIGFTKLGSTFGLYGSIALVSLLAWRRRQRRLAAILLANALLALVTNALLKHYFVRARPTLFDEITRPETWSFPSGHAMSAMAVFGGIAAVLIGLYPKRRWLIVALAIVVIGSVGVSRIYLGVHWPFDVLAGFAASAPFVVVTVHLVHTIVNRETSRAPEPRAPTRRS